jgi:hypothetical protein
MKISKEIVEESRKFHCQTAQSDGLKDRHHPTNYQNLRRDLDNEKNSVLSRLISTIIFAFFEADPKISKFTKRKKIGSHSHTHSHPV